MKNKLDGTDRRRLVRVWKEGKIGDEITVFICCWIIGAVVFGLFTYITQGNYPAFIQTIGEWPSGRNFGFYLIIAFPYIVYSGVRLLRRGK